jgi:hypothetical protein
MHITKVNEAIPVLSQEALCNSHYEGKAVLVVNQEALYNAHNKGKAVPVLSQLALLLIVVRETCPTINMFHLQKCPTDFD